MHPHACIAAKAVSKMHAVPVGTTGLALSRHSVGSCVNEGSSSATQTAGSVKAYSRIDYHDHVFHRLLLRSLSRNYREPTKNTVWAGEGIDAAEAALQNTTLVRQTSMQTHLGRRAPLMPFLLILSGLPILWGSK